MNKALDKATLKIALQQFALSDEVAKVVGLPEKYIPTYLARGKLPEPIGRLGRYHVWDRADLEEWAKQSKSDEK